MQKALRVAPGLKFYEVLKGSKDTPPPPILPESKTKSTLTVAPQKPAAPSSTSVATSTVTAQKSTAPSTVTARSGIANRFRNSPVAAPPGGRSRGGA